MDIKNAQITNVDTIKRTAVAILKYDNIAELFFISGKEYTHMEKYYGLGQFCGYDYGWVG